MKKAKINVLAVFACPTGTDRLYLDREERVIREAIELSQNSDNINLHTCPAATIRDLDRALLNETFQIVHIAGHGSYQGLILANETGGRFLVNQPALAELLQEYNSSIQCVILNACYSITQGSLLSRTVPFTIVMDAALNDQAAISFSRGFYDAICAGKSVEFAFRAGCRSIKFHFSHTTKLPLLLKQEENPFERDIDIKLDEPEEMPESFYFKEEKALVGIALDLSGSMRASIQNNTKEQISRLESIRQSLDELIKTAQKSIREGRARNEKGGIDMFIYGFGLKTMAVCDLLSLIKAGQQVISKDVIEEFKQRYRQEKQEKYKGYAGLGNLLQQVGLSSQVNIVKDIAQHQAERTIRKRILWEQEEAILQQLRRIGNTTLSIDEVSDLWGNSEDILSSAGHFIYGNTSIVEALTTIEHRFEQEIAARDKGTRLILFLVSDGIYPNTVPLSLAASLRAMGITIFSCFVTDKDSSSPRELLHDPKPEWESGARMMFEMASFLEDNTEIESFLLRKGWTIYPRPKLFVQVNHSDVLKEFIRVILGELEDTELNHTLPRGW